MQLAAQDEQGATATSFTGPITIALGANPDSATLSGTSSINAVAGVATFATLSVNRAGAGYTLLASASGLTSAASAAFDVTPSGAVQRITVTSPVNYQTYQRGANGQADIPIRGTYTGTPAAIEAQLNGGAWSTIDASPSGGTFGGTLRSQSGQGTLAVRFANDTTVTGSVNYVGIGDVFLVAGQSNASGYGNNYQAYGHASLKASMYREDGAWAELRDPTDSDDGAGSPWPLLATLYMADQGVPLAFVTAADGATGLVAPAAHWTIGGAQYGSFVAAVRNSGINDAKAILWHQGEQDARNSITKSAYETALSAMIRDMQADLGGNFADLRLVCAQIGMAARLSPTQLDAIRMAQVNRWDNDAYVLAGPVLHDIDLSDAGGDGVHFRTDAELQTLANRWWRALKHHFYGGTEPARGPRFSTATYEGNQATVILAGGQGGLANVTDATGWAVMDGNGARTLLSAPGTGNAVTLTVDRDLVAPVTVTFGSGNTGAGATLRDSGVYPLPPEPFVDEAATQGIIRVRTATAGRDLDPDGYLVTLDGRQAEAAGVNDTVTLANLAVGPHVLELSGVAGNCWPSDTLLTATVSASEITNVTFNILCMGPIPDEVDIAFVRDGVIHGMRADGRDIVDLTNHFSREPAWSPDGSRLAFVSFHADQGGDIYVVRADGTGLRQLTRQPGPDTEPAWSPDGAKIVFRTGSRYVGANAADLYIVDTDGQNLVRFTDTAGWPEGSPTWSPDGSRIAFDRTVGDAVDVFVRDVRDGLEVSLSNNSDYNIVNVEPSWSPDGANLVFRRLIRGSGTGYDIWLMKSDGSDQRLLVGWAGVQMGPGWSPDGTRIVFAGEEDSHFRIYVIGADGAGLGALTSGALDGSPTWRRRP